MNNCKRLVIIDINHPKEVSRINPAQLDALKQMYFSLAIGVYAALLKSHTDIKHFVYGNGEGSTLDVFSPFQFAATMFLTQKFIRHNGLDNGSLRNELVDRIPFQIKPSCREFPQMQVLPDQMPANLLGYSMMSAVMLLQFLAKENYLANEKKMAGWGGFMPADEKFLSRYVCVQLDELSPGQSVFLYKRSGQLSKLSAMLSNNGYRLASDISNDNFSIKTFEI